MIISPTIDELLARLDDPDAAMALTGPLGVWATCRQAARRGDVTYLDRLEACGLAESMEDNLPVAGGPGPAARVRALLAAARLACWSGEDDAAALGWLVLVADGYRSPSEGRWQPPSAAEVHGVSRQRWALAGREAPVNQVNRPVAPALRLIRSAYETRPHAGLVAALDLVDDVFASESAASESVSVALPLARHSDADIALLSVCTRSGPPGLYPEVTAAPFLRFDTAFHQALQRAWHAAHLPSLAVRWSLTWERTGGPVDAVVGGSVGLAAAIALAGLCGGRRLALPRDWLFTGGVDEAGAVLSLLGDGQGDSDLAAYRFKLVAADRRTLVLPASDHGHVAPFVERARLRACLVPVAQVEEVLRAASAVADTGAARREGAAAQVGEQPPFEVDGAYDERDAFRFFGRERALADLLHELASNRVVVLEGASGAGKSSLLRAGLVPALRRGALPGSQQWHVALVALDGRTPALEALVAAVGKWHATQSPTRSEAGAEHILIVDELHELSEPAPASRNRGSFIDELNVLAATGWRVVVAARAGRPSPNGEFRHADATSLATQLGGAQVDLAPLSEPEVRRAVLGVAAWAGVTLEPALLDALLVDMANQSAAMPHLFAALHATWRRRSGNVLTLAGYLSAGGVAHAVCSRADEFAAGLSARQQRVLDQLLLRLVQVGTDPAKDKRRPCPLTELEDLPFDTAEVATVLDRLVQARLVTTTGDVALLVHDSLLTTWPRLARPIEWWRAGLLEDRQLLDDARRWDENGKDPSFLYQGRRYGAARRYALQPRTLASPLVAAFLVACAARRRRRRLTVVGTLAVAAMSTALILFAPELWNAHRAAAARQATRTPLVEIPSAEGRKVGFESHVVTIAQFERCMADGHRCQAPERGLYLSGKPNDPMTDVTFYAADAYCAWLGRTLPTLENYLDALGVPGIGGLDDAVKEWTRTQPPQAAGAVDDWQRGDPVSRFPYFLNDKQALASAPQPVELSTVIQSKLILNVMNPRSGGRDVGFRCVKEGTTS